MKRTCWMALLLLTLLLVCQAPAPRPAAAQGTIAPSIFIQSPREGQALQGVEILDGRIRGDGFLGGKISFSHAGQDQPTWFFIADIAPEGEGGAQTSFRLEWDTTGITDGNYDLRVVAEYQDQAAIFALIPNLRIRNHSPVETSTPAPAGEGGGAETETPPAPAPTIRITPTPLPANPLVVAGDDLVQTLRFSLIGVVVLFIVGGLYWLIRQAAYR